eukprot:scaffold74911_cov35-Tisochrysis_lutea.AAC.4
MSHECDGPSVAVASSRQPVVARIFRCFFLLYSPQYDHGRWGRKDNEGFGDVGRRPRVETGGEDGSGRAADGSEHSGGESSEGIETITSDPSSWIARAHKNNGGRKFGFGSTYYTRAS